VEPTVSETEAAATETAGAEMAAATEAETEVSCQNQSLNVSMYMDTGTKNTGHAGQQG
jgi:hypothetical protein